MYFSLEASRRTYSMPNILVRGHMRFEDDQQLGAGDASKLVENIQYLETKVAHLKSYRFQGNSLINNALILNKEVTDVIRAGTMDPSEVSDWVETHPGTCEEVRLRTREEILRLLVAARLQYPTLDLECILDK